MTPRGAPPARWWLVVGLTALVAEASSGCSRGLRLPPGYQQGARLEAQGDDEGALAAYNAAVHACVRDQEPCRLSRLRAAETLARLDRPREAVAAYLGLRDFTADPATAARAQQGAAELLQDALGDLTGALRLYKQTVLTFPAEAAAEDALDRLVAYHRAHTSAGETARLLLVLLEHAGGAPIADNILLEAATLYEQTGHPFEAAGLYDQLWASYPRSTLADDAMFRAGTLLEQQGRYGEALARYRRLVQTRREAVLMGSYNSVHLDDAQLRIAVILSDHLSNRRAALEELATLRDDFPTSLLRDDAQYKIAEIYRQEGQREAACAALGRLVRDFPDGNHVRKARATARELGCSP